MKNSDLPLYETPTRGAEVPPYGCAGIDILYYCRVLRRNIDKAFPTTKANPSLLASYVDACDKMD